MNVTFFAIFDIGVENEGKGEWDFWADWSFWVPLIGGRVGMVRRKTFRIRALG